jgi:hypothetical protein
LVDGSRFKDLIDPLHLPDGFQGTIVAEGYNSAEPNGNAGAALPITMNFDLSVEQFGQFQVSGSSLNGVPGGTWVASSPRAGS